MRNVRSPGRTGPRRFPISLLSRLLIALTAVLLLGTTSAQICEDEFLAAARTDVTETRQATALARVALEALEPALPDSYGAAQIWDDPNAQWLHRHGFLPGGWNENGELTPEMWAQLLGLLQRPYRIEPLPLSGNTDPATLLGEIQAVLQRVASTLRPLALLATRPGDRLDVASVSVIWNWTPWPRLLIFQPHNLGVDGSASTAELLANVGTCAWQPRAYFRTDMNTASGYYLGNSEGRVRLLATDMGHRNELVPNEQAQQIFAFEADLLRGANVAAVGFEGPGPSTWQVLTFLTKAETNIGAFDLPYYLSFP